MDPSRNPVLVAAGVFGVLGVALGAFGTGIALFSGSLYAMALTSITALGMVTPVGGAAFLAGWAALIAAGLAKPSSKT